MSNPSTTDWRYVRLSVFRRREKLLIVRQVGLITFTKMHIGKMTRRGHFDLAGLLTYNLWSRGWCEESVAIVNCAASICEDNGKLERV